MASTPETLDKPQTLRLLHARIEHNAWIKDHPNFSSKDLLEAWTRIQQTWELPGEKT